MKRLLCLLLTLTALAFSLFSCRASDSSNSANANKPQDTPQGQQGPYGDQSQGGASFETEDFTAQGDDVTENLYDGYFDGESDFEILYVSGTKNAYTIENNVVYFNSISEDSTYSISGKLNGSIVIDVGEDHKLELEMQGFSLISESTNPITVLSGSEVTLQAKKDTVNYIYDEREAIDTADQTLYSAAIYSLCDLEISGKGELNVSSKNNNGIHSKDDLQVKNLTLLVFCADNALKGNDSVTVENATTTLIATVGDGIKTTNSDISSKANQRGTVTLLGGTHNIYSACDAIDSAYDVIIDDSSTVLNIFTDKYSAHSNEVTSVNENLYYIRFTTNVYKYSVKYYNSDTDYLWVNAEHHSTVSGERSNYYYYSLPKHAEYEKMQFFIYSSDMESGQDESYLACTDYLTPKESYDTFALTSRGGSVSYSWTNYTTNIQEGMGGMGGMGGMNEGNTEKSDHSAKGIKASNQITVNNGTVSIKSYDDAIHANNTDTLENGESALGNVTVNGGVISIYSNDDGIHADGTLLINGGSVTVSYSYEGLEGYCVQIMGGDVSVISRDDGINATATSGTSISLGGGKVYIYCSGDGIDSNSRSSYTGIDFCGSDVIVISTSNGNSAIDTEAGYKYSSGRVVAIMPSGAMTSESTHVSGFSSIATSKSMSLSSGSYLNIDNTVTVKMPCAISGTVIYLGSSSASITSSSSSSATLDSNGVYFK